MAERRCISISAPAFARLVEVAQATGGTHGGVLEALLMHWPNAASAEDIAATVARLRTSQHEGKVRGAVKGGKASGAASRAAAQARDEAPEERVPTAASCPCCRRLPGLQHGMRCGVCATACRRNGNAYVQGTSCPAALASEAA